VFVGRYSVTATTFATLTKTAAACQQTTVCSPDPTAFYLRASNGQYLQNCPAPGLPLDVGKLYPVDLNSSGATIFAIDAAGNVYLPGLTGPEGGVIYLTGGGASGEATYVITSDQNLIGPGNSKIPCELDSTTLQRTCTMNRLNVFGFYEGNLLIVTSAFPAEDYVTLYADCS
jgi:hypothetical protein